LRSIIPDYFQNVAKENFRQLSLRHQPEVNTAINSPESRAGLKALQNNSLPNSLVAIIKKKLFDPTLCLCHNI
jgi:hypothetical protein